MTTGRTLNMSLSHLVEPLRLFHPTQIKGRVRVFIHFFVSLYSTQSKTVGWNKRSGSTMTLHTPYKLDCLKQEKRPTCNNCILRVQRFYRFAITDPYRLVGSIHPTNCEFI